MMVCGAGAGVQGVRCLAGQGCGRRCQQPVLGARGRAVLRAAAAPADAAVNEPPRM
jgi:hypothetical protein